MKYLGDYDTATVIYGKFATFRPSTGACFTLGGTPALSVYKDSSTTESTAGVTLTPDFDSRTGLNHFAIDTSADGTFYAAGSNFDVVITAGTVDSVSVVGAVVAHFTLRKNSALKPATAGRTLVVDAAGLADSNTVKQGPSGSGVPQTARDMGASVLLSPGTGTGQIDLTAGIPKANLTQILGTALTETAGQLAAGFKKFFNIASPAATMDHGILVDTVTNLTNAPSDSSGTTTLLARLTAPRATNLDNLDATVSSRLASASYTAPPSAASIASTVMASIIEGAYTLTQWLRLTGAAMIGKADGLSGTTVHYRDTGDSKNRITATVDTDGNRTAVTLDAS